jgi:hypothetical protein
MELGERRCYEGSLLCPSASCRQKNIQTTPILTLVAFLCVVYQEVLPFLASLARRAMEAMVFLRNIMAVAMGCFMASSASLQWSHH